MDRAVSNGVACEECQRLFELRSNHSGCLSDERRLRLKGDGRPCPRIKYQGRASDSVYAGVSWVCCGEKEDGKETFFCWPCLVMGDISRVCYTLLAFALHRISSLQHNIRMSNAPNLLLHLLFELSTTLFKLNFKNLAFKVAVIAGQEPRNVLRNVFANNGYCTMQPAVTQSATLYRGNKISSFRTETN